MRISLSPLLLVLIAVPAIAQQRTWTIARDVYTVEGDLLAVRGDTAYLKIGDKVESVPLAQLSAADHQFIASLALAPVTPGPASEPADATPMSGPLIPSASGDILPVPGAERSLVVPAGATAPFAGGAVDAAVAEEMLPLPAGQTAAPPAQGPANPLGQPNANRRPADEGADRRFWRQPPPPNNRARDSDDDDDDEPRRFRARRLERQRANASR